jgi:hypothetical protein
MAEKLAMVEDGGGTQSDSVRRFSRKLYSHKVCRWLLPWAFLAGLAALISHAFHEPLAGMVVARSTTIVAWF